MGQKVLKVSVSMVPKKTLSTRANVPVVPIHQKILAHTNVMTMFVPERINIQKNGEGSFHSQRDCYDRSICIHSPINTNGMLLSVYGVLLSVYGMLLSVYGMSLSVYGMSLSVYGMSLSV